MVNIVRNYDLTSEKTKLDVLQRFDMKIKLFREVRLRGIRINE